METGRQSALPRRQRRLPVVFDASPSYFLTICTKDRCSVLANVSVDERLRQFASGSLDRYGVWIDSYVLMPDHVHMIVTVAGDTTLGSWIKAFKAFVGNREFCWQEGFFDHVLRSDESRWEKWDYIRMNPVRAGLVSDAEEWQYCGWFDPRTGLVMKNEL